MSNRSHKNDNPCYGCTDRWVDAENGKKCHSSCERYLSRKEKEDAKRSQFIEQKKKENIYESYRRIRVAKYRHTKGERK